MKINVLGMCCALLSSVSLIACAGGFRDKKPHRQCLLIEHIIGPQHPRYHEFMADYQQVFHDNGIDEYTFIGYLIKKYNIVLPEKPDLSELLGLSSSHDAKTDEARAKEVVFSMLPGEPFDLHKAAVYAVKLQESMAFAKQFDVQPSKDYDQALNYFQRVAAQQQR
jgi:hypothetical protein